MIGYDAGETKRIQCAMARPEGGVSMERVTQKNERGYYLLGDGIYSDWGVPEKFRGDDVDRLAAYEDTGLEPEEIAKIKQDVEDGYMKSTARRYGIDVSRLRELAQADREGRVVVQRFSPGQTVWVIERDEDGEAYDFSGYVFVTSLRGIALVSPKINGSSEIDVILMDQVESRINYADGCIEAYPADDCYLSREAAEKALGEDARGQEEEPSGC